MPDITKIVPPRVAFTDPRTGLISREWYRFLLNLFHLTGSGRDVAHQSILMNQVFGP